MIPEDRQALANLLGALVAISVIGLAELRWPGVLLWLVIGLGLLLGLVAVVVRWAAAHRGRDDRDE